ILISTHDLDLVSLYCDQSVVINKGHIDFNGTTDDLIMQPNLLRANHLRLPRIAHLMEILDTKDSIEVDRHVATISQARKQIKKLIGEDNE
ncbi:MAG: hypothetical protein RR543_02620, partial [Erysipelotrichales bacterium]